MQWSDYQHEIFRFTEETDDSFAVLARAGSGKTTTIKEVCNRIKRRSVLVCAFNVATREDLRHAITAHGVEVANMHSLGFSALKKLWGPLEVDRNRQRTMIREIVPADVAGGRSDLAKLVSLCMATLSDTEESIRRIMGTYSIQPTLASLQDDYVRWAKMVLERSCERSAIVSHDDQVYIPAKLGLRAGKFDVVIVDEFQDLNFAQQTLAENSLRSSGRMIVVGDDRQTLYAFNGASPTAISGFLERRPMPIFSLPITYRCPREVVSLVNYIVPDLQAAPGAARGTVSMLTEEEFLQKVQPGDAVISRLNSGLMRYAMKLLADGRRIRFFGRDMADAVEGLFNRCATRSRSLPQVLDAIDAHVAVEVERLTTAGNEEQAEELKGNAQAVHAIAGKAGNSVAEVRSKMRFLFATRVDDPEQAEVDDAILLMSVHRAKGLEFNRVFMLEYTFSIGNDEGQNLYYVAATRAKRELYLVQFPREGDKPARKSIAEQFGFFDGEAIYTDYAVSYDPPDSVIEEPVEYRPVSVDDLFDD